MPHRGPQGFVWSSARWQVIRGPRPQAQVMAEEAIVWRGDVSPPQEEQGVIGGPSWDILAAVSATHDRLISQIVGRNV